MKIFKVGVVFVVVSVVASAAFAAGRTSVPSEPMVTLDPSPGWSIGFRTLLDRREFVFSDSMRDFDMTRSAGRLGYAAAPFLNMWTEIGYGKAEHGEKNGKGGPAWAVGARANILEHVIKSSPAVGKKQVAGVVLDISYDRIGTEFDDGDFELSALTLSPSVSYTINREGETVWYPYSPMGIRVSGGLMFSVIDGSYGSADLTEDDDSGFSVEVDLRWVSGWSTEIESFIYSSGDRALSLGFAYNF